MARTSAALLVDSDLKGLEALVYGFQGADWRITACPSPDAAAFLVKASGADVVVVVSRDPHDKTLALIRQLQSQADTKSLPVLVLGPASLRASAQECGSIDFLSTPVFVRDTITAGRIAIAVARDPELKVETSLAELSLLSVLRSMIGLGRSGVLKIERAGRRGELLFSEGELTGAQLGTLQGTAALHHLLMWADGTISLCLRSVGRRAPVNQRFDQIIDEAERFLRDYTHAMAGLGSSATVYDKNESKLSGSARSLPSEVMPIVRLCDGQRTLADLIDQSPFRVFDTIRIVARLVDSGALSRRPAAQPPSQPVQELETFWETARIASPDDSSAPAQIAARVSADTRVGEPSRRKLQRRARAETPSLGTPVTELMEPKAPASQSVATAQPTPDEASKGKERTSGVLQVATGERRQAKMDRRERPSVTIDVGLVEAALQVPTPPPTEKPSAASMAASPSVTPATGKRIVPTPAGGSQSPAPGPAPAPVTLVAAEASAPRSARITGTLQVAPSGARRTGKVPIASASVAVDPALANPTPPPQVVVSGSTSSAPSGTKQPAGPSETSRAPTPPVGVAKGELSRGRVTGTLSVSPSQRTSVPTKAASPQVSVQLDPVLVAELDRLEKSTAPVNPPAFSEAPTAPGRSSGGSRITGTLSVSPLARSSHKTHKAHEGTGPSVALDPALVQEAQKPTAPAPAPAVSPPKESPVAEASAAKRPSQSHPAEGEGRAGARISGAFSAIESDFFAREADLYKRDNVDNFSDLDEPAGRTGAKNGNHRRQR